LLALALGVQLFSGVLLQPTALPTCCVAVVCTCPREASAIPTPCPIERAGRHPQSNKPKPQQATPFALSVQQGAHITPCHQRARHASPKWSPRPCWQHLHTFKHNLGNLGNKGERQGNEESAPSPPARGAQQSQAVTGSHRQSQAVKPHSSSQRQSSRIAAVKGSQAA